MICSVADGAGAPNHALVVFFVIGRCRFDANDDLGIVEAMMKRSTNSVLTSSGSRRAATRRRPGRGDPPAAGHEQHGDDIDRLLRW